MQRVTVFCLLVCLSLTACTMGLAKHEVLTVGANVLTTPDSTPSAVFPTMTLQPSSPLATPMMTPSEASPLATVTVTRQIELPPAILPRCDKLGATSTYRDQTVGFELDYPAEWYITTPSAEIREQSSNYSVVLTSWDPDSLVSHERAGTGGKVDIVLFKTGVTTLEEAAINWRPLIEGGEYPGTILAEERWALTGNLQVLRWLAYDSEYQELGTMFITGMNGYTVILNSISNPDLGEAIVCTMRPF
jgi:hypothetical protein